MCVKVYVYDAWMSIMRVFNRTENSIFWNLSSSFRVNKISGDMKEYQGNWVNRHLQL
jgi:hypothetical protein